MISGGFSKTFKGVEGPNLPEYLKETRAFDLGILVNYSCFSREKMHKTIEVKAKK